MYIKPLQCRVCSTRHGQDTRAGRNATLRGGGALICIVYAKPSEISYFLFERVWPTQQPRNVISRYCNNTYIILCYVQQLNGIIFVYLYANVDLEYTAIRLYYYVLFSVLIERPWSVRYYSISTHISINML